MNLDLNAERRRFVDAFFCSCDLIHREIITEYVDASCFYLDSMIDREELELSILKPLTLFRGSEPLSLDVLKGVLSSSCAMKTILSFEEAVQTIARGDMIMISRDIGEYMSFALKKVKSRAISEPPTSTVIKGPREGFVEDIKTNMVLLRRRIKSNRLVLRTLNLGRVSGTPIVVCYIDGVAKTEIVEKIFDRLREIDPDGVMDSSSITKILEAKPYSLFKQVGNTEKPDIGAAKLLDGRVLILVDGSPLALTVPFLLIEDFEDVQDKYKRSIRTSFLRLMRVIAVFFALLLPGVFVAVQVHQYQVLPLQLLITVINATANIPFSPTVEMIIALVIFEILGEASIRMPRHIGMALSVVGAIVLGETAVKAGLLSSITVLTVAISGIGLYAVPDEVGPMSIMRIFLVFIGGLLGIFGILLVLIALTAYLNSIKTFGVPYLAPFAPILEPDLQNTVFQRSFIDEKVRPTALKLDNKTRLRENFPK